RRTRGYAVCALLADELAFWPTDETSAEPDREIIDAVRAGMVQFGDKALLLAASSPYAKRGELWTPSRRRDAVDGDACVTWKAPALVMNPSVPRATIDATYERDAVWARAEYGAEFRDDLTQLVAREVVEGCVDAGVLERRPIEGIPYKAFVDPSGGSSDS